MPKRVFTVVIWLEGKNKSAKEQDRIARQLGELTLASDVAGMAVCIYKNDRVLEPLLVVDDMGNLSHYTWPKRPPSSIMEFAESMCCRYPAECYVIVPDYTEQARDAFLALRKAAALEVHDAKAQGADSRDRVCPSMPMGDMGGVRC